MIRRLALGCKGIVQQLYRVFSFKVGSLLPAIAGIADMKDKAKSQARETRMLVYMSRAQRKGLRAAGRASGTSQQVLIRRGIDLVLKVRS